MAKIYCKYGGSTVSGAKNFSLTDVMDGTGQFTFQIAQQTHKEFSTWTARKNGEVTFYNSTDDSILFIGVITAVTSRKNWITISGMGWMEALKWYPISEDQTNFEIWNGKVYDAPTIEAVTDTDDDNFADASWDSGVGAESTASSSQLVGTTWDLSTSYDTDDEYAYLTYTTGDHDFLDNTYYEFKVYVSMPATANQRAIIDFGSGFGSWAFYIRFVYNTDHYEFQYSLNGSVWTFIQNALKETWYTIKLVSKPATDHISIYVDTILKNENIDKTYSGFPMIAWYVDAQYADGTCNMQIKDFTASIQHYAHHINVCESDGSTATETNPGFSDDGYNQTDVDRYLIISDSTKKEEELTFFPTSIFENNGFAINGAVGNLTDIDTNYCECSRAAAEIAAATPGLIYLPLTIDADETIPDSAMITKIRVYLIGRVDFNVYAQTQNCDVYWSKDGSALTRNIGTFQRYPTNTVYHGVDICNFDFDTTINIDSGDSSSWLATSGGEYIDGGIIIRWNYASGAHFYINQAFVTIYYATTTFDPVNQLISDTVHNVPANPSTNGYDTIKCYDTSGNADIFAFGGIGIAESDTAQICIGVAEAVSRCMKAKDCPAFWVELNENVDPCKGIAKKWVGATVFSGLADIADQLGYVKFPRYNATNSMKEVHMLPEANIDNAAVTYSSASDPPNEIDQIESQNNNYGWVVVCYKNGSTAPVQADTPSSDVKTKVIIDRNIVSETEAYEKAKAWANYYAIDHPSIELTWGALPTNLFVIGTKYNFELDTYNGTIYTTTDFSNAICRRRTITQDGTPNGAWKIKGWFGGGSTPPNEKTGKKLAELSNRIYKRDITDLTSDFTPVTVHSRLSGILGTGSQHISAAEAAWLTAVAASLPRGLVELQPAEESCTNNVTTAGYINLADNDTDVGAVFGRIPADMKTGGKADLVLVYYNNQASGKTIDLMEVALSIDVKNGAYATYINNWNAEAGDIITCTTTLAGNVTAKAEHFTVLTDSTAFSAEGGVWFKFKRKASTDSWGAAAYLRAYILYERDFS